MLSLLQNALRLMASSSAYRPCCAPSTPSVAQLASVGDSGKGVPPGTDPAKMGRGKKIHIIFAFMERELPSSCRFHSRFTFFHPFHPGSQGTERFAMPQVHQNRVVAAVLAFLVCPAVPSDGFLLSPSFMLVKKVGDERTTKTRKNEAFRDEPGVLALLVPCSSLGRVGRDDQKGVGGG